MKHIWSVICEKSTIDTESNGLSLLNSIEQLTINISEDEDLPERINLPVNFEIVSFWWSDKIIKNNANVIVELLSPENEKIKEFKMDIKGASQKNRRIRTRMRISGLGIAGSGDYFFKVRYKDNKDKKYETVATLPVEIVINQKPYN